MFLFAEDLDKRLGWKPGRAERLARQRRLPYVLLPDGSIRFDWNEIEPLIVRIQAVAVTTGRRVQCLTALTRLPRN
jgi:hypothetical protein